MQPPTRRRSPHQQSSRLSPLAIGRFTAGATPGARTRSRSPDGVSAVATGGHGEIRVLSGASGLGRSRSRSARGSAAGTPSPARLQDIPAHRVLLGTHGSPEPLKPPVWERAAQLPQLGWGFEAVSGSRRSTPRPRYSLPGSCQSCGMTRRSAALVLSRGTIVSGAKTSRQRTHQVNRSRARAQRLPGLRGRRR